MIPAVDQIGTNTGTAGLAGILTAEDQKRIGSVRGGPGIGRTDELAGRQCDLFPVHLSGPGSAEMGDHGIVFRQIQLGTQASFHSDVRVRVIDQAGTAGDHVTVGKYRVK